MKKYIQPETKEVQLHLGAALLQASTGSFHPDEEADPGTPGGPGVNFSPRHNSILWEDDVEEEEM